MASKKKIALITLGSIVAVGVAAVALNWGQIRRYQAIMLTVTAVNALGCHNYDEAERMDKESMEITKTVLPSVYLVAASNMSKCYFGQGRKQEAEQYLKTILPISTDPRRMKEDQDFIDEQLSELYSKEGRYVEAEKLVRGIAEAQEKSEKPGPTAFEDLAVSLSGQGKEKEAQPFFVKAIQLRLAKETKSDRHLGLTQLVDDCILAACLNSQKQTGKPSQTAEADELTEQAKVAHIKIKDPEAIVLCRKALAMYKASKVQNELTDARKLICLSIFCNSMMLPLSDEDTAEKKQNVSERDSLRKKLLQGLGISAETE